MGHEYPLNGEYLMARENFLSTFMAHIGIIMAKLYHENGI